MADDARLSVGDWTADRLLGQLFLGDREQALEPKVMDLLFVLASNPGRVFAHEELRQALWPNAVVGDDYLTRCVSKLRGALKQLDGTAGSIETVPKRGYRLQICAPRQQAKPPANYWWKAAAAAVVVILILLNMVSVLTPKVANNVSGAEIQEARRLSDLDAARQDSVQTSVSRGHR